MYTYKRFRNGTVALYWKATQDASRRFELARAHFRPIPAEECSAPPRPKGTWDWREAAGVVGWALVGTLSAVLSIGISVGGAALMLVGIPWALATHHEAYIYALLTLMALGSIFSLVAAHPRIWTWFKEAYGD